MKTCDGYILSTKESLNCFSPAVLRYNVRRDKLLHMDRAMFHEQDSS